MPCDARDHWNRAAHFEYAGGGFVSQVVKMQVVYTQQAGRPREICRNAARIVGEKQVAQRLCQCDASRLIWYFAPDVVTDFFAGVFHIAHQNARGVVRRCRFKISAGDPCYFILAAGRKQCERDDRAHRHHALAALAFASLGHEAKAFAGVNCIRHHVPPYLDAIGGPCHT